MLNTQSSKAAILVPIANPETATQLVSTAIDLATDRDLRIELLTVIRVPEQLPLAAGKRLVDDERDVINDAGESVSNHDIEVSGHIRFSRSVASGILTMIEEYDIQIALLGWRGQPRRRDIVLGSHLDQILKNATCDVLVERMGGTEVLDSILLPVAGGPNTALAATVAGALGRVHDADLHVVTIRPPTSTSREQKEVETMLTRVVGDFAGIPVITQEVIEHESVAKALVGQSAGCDLIVLGAASSTLFRRSLVGSLPERVGRESQCPVIIAKRYQNVRSLMARTVSRARNEFRISGS
jgi:nucleotide-binding universal stress UspA family protein